MLQASTRFPDWSLCPSELHLGQQIQLLLLDQALSKDLSQSLSRREIHHSNVHYSVLH